MNLLKLFTRNQVDSSAEGRQTQDALFFGKRLRVIISFDSYYSQYGCEHWDKNNEFQILDIDDTRKQVKYLFSLPFKIPYTVNNSDSIIFWAKPQVFWILT